MAVIPISKGSHTSSWQFRVQKDLHIIGFQTSDGGAEDVQMC